MNNATVQAKRAAASITNVAGFPSLRAVVVARAPAVLHRDESSDNVSGVAARVVGMVVAMDVGGVFVTAASRPRKAVIRRNLRGRHPSAALPLF